MADPPTQEFCIKLSMAAIEGRPLSVTITRFQHLDHPLIGCSSGFLNLSGLQRNEVLGRNCRFLNLGLSMQSSTRERLHHTMHTGAPFLGVLNNRRCLGDGCWETFDNLLHMMVVFAGDRGYILAIQVDVTGLHLDVSEGSQDAVRLQMMFDSVFACGADSWINFQEGKFEEVPLYVYIRHAGDRSIEEIDIVERQGFQQDLWNQTQQQVPDDCLVLSPQFSPMALQDDMFNVNNDAGLQDALPGANPMDSRCFPDRALAMTPDWDFNPFEDARKNFTEYQGYGQAGPPPGQAQHPGNGKGVRSAVPHPPRMSLLSTDSEQVTQAMADGATAPTMKTQLRALDLEDPATILIVRGISKLGLSADDTLSDYFGSFGTVKAVHIPHTFKKCGCKNRKKNKKNVEAAQNANRETRAPGRCFIVMDTSEQRNHILTSAVEHLVHGVKVTLEPFVAKANEVCAQD